MTVLISSSDFFIAWKLVASLRGVIRFRFDSFGKTIGGAVLFYEWAYNAWCVSFFQPLMPLLLCFFILILQDCILILQLFVLCVHLHVFQGYFITQFCCKSCLRVIGFVQNCSPFMCGFQQIKKLLSSFSVFLESKLQEIPFRFWFFVSPNLG